MTKSLLLRLLEASAAQIHNATYSSTLMIVSDAHQMLKNGRGHALTLNPAVCKTMDHT